MKYELKKEADEVMTKKGNVRGDVLRDHFLYVKEKEGEEGLKEMEKIMEELGYPLEFNDIKVLEWYPDAYCGLMLLLLKKHFGWTERDIQDMGTGVLRYSFIVTRLLLRYLVSAEKLLEAAPLTWRKHLDFGELEVVEHNKEEKRIVLRTKDYDIHPLTCVYQKGYYAGLFRYTVRSDNISVTETKCLHKGDPYHEFVVEWD